MVDTMRTPPAPPSAARRRALKFAPILVLATTYPAFVGFSALWGDRLGYLAGFGVYWVLWGGLFSAWILGRRGVTGIWRGIRLCAGRSRSIAIGLLLLPPALAAGTVSPAKVPGAGAAVILLSLGLAAVNGTLEEILWRGAYIRAFPGDAFWGFLYPATGFAVWHLSPQAVHANPMPGGTVTFLGGALFVGLCWGWVAWRTGSIRWTVLSHVAMNFLGLGATIYLAG